MRIAGDATELVGNTPMVWLDRVAEGLHARIAAKLEFYSTASSVKDRNGLAMNEAAERQHRRRPGLCQCGERLQVRADHAR